MKKKLYPYGDIPDREVIEQFQTGHVPVVTASSLSLMPVEEEEHKNPLVAMSEKMDSLYSKYRDWTAVYAFMNMD